jgi:AcrR family transcriptional regulator
VRIYDEAVAGRRRLTPEQRRDELMDVGATLFGEYGYDDVLMEDVAQQADASRALMYHYFSTKRDFFAAIWKRAHDRLLADMSVEGARSVRDGVAAALVAHLEFYERHVRLVAIANRSSIATDSALRVPIADGMRTWCERVLDASGAAGHTRELASAALAGWIAFVREVTVQWLLDERLSRSEVIGMCMAALDGALSPHLDLLAAAPMSERRDQWR